jgi:hypothetical protein
MQQQELRAKATAVATIARIKREVMIGMLERLPPLAMKKTACGTTSESTMRMATAQGGVGSPHIGLIPTMRPLPLSTKVTVKP